MNQPIEQLGRSLIDGTDLLSIGAHYVLERAAYPEVQTVNPGTIYALLASQPRSWWWDGGQSNCLYFFEKSIPLALRKTPVTGAFYHEMDDRTAALTIDLCESGRFVLVLTERDGSAWVLLDKERQILPGDVGVEITRNGGNEPGVLPQAAVLWNDAWHGIVGFFMTEGGRERSLNWQSYEEVERKYGREVYET